MSKQTVRYPFVVVLITVLLMLVIAQPLAAKDNSGKVEVVGTVSSIDKVAGSFQVQGQDSKTYTVIPDDGFDLSKLQVGDIVEVKGTLNADGSISALKIKIDQEGGDDEHGPSAGYFCTQSDVPHPLGAQLAKRYEMKYEDLQAWFCDGYGWGQIRLALRTGKSTGADPAELLRARRSGEGWGKIWQELKLIGRAKVDASPVIEAGNAQSVRAGQSDVMKAKGKPAVTGQSDVMKAKGKPDAAGQSNNGKGKK